jgi:selenocysteine lyase/cysteine desulfurase
VGLDTAQRRVRELADYARIRLAAVPGVRVLDRGPELCAIVTVAIAGRDTANVKLELRTRGINTSSPHREDAVIDMDEKQANSALRISPHYYNTKEEIDTAVEALQEIVSS